VLIRFEVANFRSIAAPVELSMVAVDHDRPAARHQPRLNESLLTRAAVYGPNASGKSNLIAAVIWLKNAVRFSLRQWEETIPVDPFRLGSEPPGPSSFTIEMVIDGVRFEYILELDREAVAYEALFHYPERKRRRVFEREGLDLTLQRGLGALSGTRELLTNRTLVLSAARRFDEPLVTGFFEAIGQVQAFWSNWSPMLTASVLGATAGSGQASLEFWRDDVTAAAGGATGSDREKALAMLRLADLGIEDVRVVDREAGATGLGSRVTTTALELLHRSAAGNVALDYRHESHGTQIWLGLIGPVLTALRQGSLMFFDELDASLHPTISAELLRIFADRALNPLGAQLVFTSHDTSLLNHLNRDEVWLTEKRLDGSTRLGALAEFAGERVRKSQNLENAYLHGRFGALPQVDQTDLLRSLGLIG
jgi:uncharacterized protein